MENIIRAAAHEKFGSHVAERSASCSPPPTPDYTPHMSLPLPSPPSSLSILSSSYMDFVTPLTSPPPPASSGYYSHTTSTHFSLNYPHSILQLLEEVIKGVWVEKIYEN